MEIDIDRLADQVKLAYEFMEVLHGQAIALIRDIETQLIQAPEELQCMRPGGYRFTVNPLSYGLERPQVPIPEYYAVCLRQFRDRVRNTPLDTDVAVIGFVKVVLKEPKLAHPEVRFGVFSDVKKPPDRADAWPKKFEDIISYAFASSELKGPAWYDRGTVRDRWEQSYISLAICGKGVRLGELPDSQVIAERIAEPLLALYRDVAPAS